MKFKFTPEMIVSILSVLPSLITGIETLFGSGNGAAKKQVVTEMASVALNAWTTNSTGGQKQTAETLAPAISGVIDALVPVLIPKDETDTSAVGLGG